MTALGVLRVFVVNLGVFVVKLPGSSRHLITRAAAEPCPFSPPEAVD